MSNYGYRKDIDGYVVTRDGEDYLHTFSMSSTADIVERLMYDSASLCDINDCIGCPRYGNDCDGKSEE